MLLVARFDRRAGGARVGYLSAMSLVGAHDGQDRDYLDIAEELTAHGAAVNEDLTELFRRAAFSVAVHNTDDHLRNHGFLRAPGGWRVAPVFDVNPEPDPGRTRVTSIAGAIAIDHEPEGLLLLAEQCRLKPDRARAVIREAIAAVGQWRNVAAQNGISAAEQSRFADVLDGCPQALTRLVH